VDDRTGAPQPPVDTATGGRTPGGRFRAADKLAGVQWSTRAVETAGAATASGLLALAALFVDPVGRVLVGGAAVVLLAVAARDLVLRPRLRTDAAGVTVRTVGGTHTIPWGALRTRVRVTRRLGTRSRTLELEDVRDDAVLLVLGRRDLGTDPDVVARALPAAGGAPDANG
jgi:hypothetical protein